MNPFEALAARLIAERAEAEHATMCARPALCRDGWHVKNAYVPRIRREVIAEMRAALEVLA